MARSFGRLYSRMWAPGSDFAALGPLEQRLYMFLLSQPNLNHAGVLPITLRRWATMTVGLTPKQIEQQLRALEFAEWVVLDWDQEELLITTHLLDDEVWKQPRVMGAAVSSALEVGSLRLRQALLAQVERIPLDELSDDPGPRDTPSVRRQVEDHIITLRLAFRSEGSSETPGDGPAEGDPQALGNPSAGVGEGDPQDTDQGSTRVGARVFSPSTSPEESGARTSAPPPPPDESGRKRGTRLPEDFKVTPEMHAWFVENIPDHVNGKIETQKFRNYWTAKSGRDAVKLDWVATWRNWMLKAADGYR